MTADYEAALRKHLIDLLEVDGMLAALVAPRFKGLRLFTNKLFDSNVDLYLRHGFAVDREEPFMRGITVYTSKSLAGTNTSISARATS